MTGPLPPEVSLSALGPRTRIGAGGQGTVYALTEDPRWVYKEYATRFVDDVDVTTLHRFVRLAADAGPDADALLGLAAWPTAIVRKEGVVRGFLMPRVPDRFRVRIQLPRGADTVLAQVQYLLNSDDYLRDRGLHIDNRMRLELLRDTGEALTLLHRLGVCVGDLSPNNLLFSLDARPRCYFIDCDAMRLDGDSVLAQAETPEWHVPDADAEELATPATDAFKFGLLAVRLFAGDQQTRDPDGARRRLDRQLLTLAGRSLDPDPQRRPAPEQWLPTLDRSIHRTPPTPVEPVAPPTEQEPPHRNAARPDPVRRIIPKPRVVSPQPAGRGWGLLVGAMVAIAVLAGLISANSDSSGTTSRTTLPTGFRWTAPPPSYPGLPMRNPDPLLPAGSSAGVPRYPGLPLPTRFDLEKLLPLTRACILSDVTVGPGLNRSSARTKAAVVTVGSFLCGLNIDAPRLVDRSKTQIARAGTLTGKGPFRVATIIGIRTAASGNPQVNVVFAPSGAGSSAGCWRSRLSLVKDGDGYDVGSLSAPVRASCP
ncbi:hypothetical protein GA0070216_12050 [Micromonospora matsumotoense]|uniref:Protein kinase domain-containing protein n=1 Tax=Micromonospora matsumotoense TaxID=121616 RepID=A0A1C5AN92_9ACTN|nr:hypothetical protein [Micromonospora matsumotoense]SCF46705.1 hypothetical protein GA0070216_12050 [Micromonospora matsumotoense]